MKDSQKIVKRYLKIVKLAKILRQKSKGGTQLTKINQNEPK